MFKVMMDRGGLEAHPVADGELPGIQVQVMRRGEGQVAVLVAHIQGTGANDEVHAAATFIGQPADGGDGADQVHEFSAALNISVVIPAKAGIHLPPVY